MKHILQSFIVQTLIFSIILMPYQSIAADRNTTTPANAAEADAEECNADSQGGGYTAGVYTSGACVATTIERAQLTNHGGYKKNWMKWIEQAIVGMSAVNLVEALKYKGRDEVYKNAYGKQCANNFGAKVTPALLATGSGAFLIGDIWANTYFRNAAKNAFDEKFAKKQNEKGKDNFGLQDGATVNDNYSSTVDLNQEAGDSDFSTMGTEEYEKAIKEFQSQVEDKKDNQLEAYNALIAILKKQKEGMKIKLGFAYGAEAAYLSAIITEGLSIRGCNSVCEGTRKGIDAKWKVFDGLKVTADTAIEAAKTTTKASYETAKTARQTAQSNQFTAAAVAALKIKEEAAHKKYKACKALGRKFKDFTRKTKIDKPKNIAKAIKKTMKKEAKSLKETKKAKDIFSTIKDIFVKDPTVASVTTTTDVTKIVKDNAVDQAEEKSEVAIAQKSQIEQLSKISKEAIEKKGKFTVINAKAKICGNGVGAPVSEALGGWTTYRTSKVMGCGGDGIAKTISPEVISLIQGMFSSTGAKSTSTAATTISDYGNLFRENMFKTNCHSTTSDNVFQNIFKVGSLNDKKFFLKESFERMLRQTLISIYTENRIKKPLALIRQMKSDEEKIKSVVKEYQLFLDGYLQNESQFELAKVQKNKHWKKIISKVTDLFIPSAHAMSGIVSMGAGALLGMAEQLNIKGPWVPVMNVGSRFLMVQAVLKRYFRNFGMVKPKGRVVSSGVLAGVTAAVIVTDHQAIKKIDDNIAFMEAERQRFDNGTGNRIARNTDVDGGVAANANYGANNSVNGGRKIATCLNFRNSTYVPSNCSKSNKTLKLNIKDVMKSVPTNMQASFGSGISSLSNLANKSASGDFSENDFSGEAFGSMQKTNGALRNYAQSLVDDIDKKSNNGDKDRSLASAIKDFEKALGTRGSFSGDNNIADSIASVSSSRSSSNADPKSPLSQSGLNSKKAVTGAAGAIGAFSGGGDDLDFMDDEEMQADMLSGAESKAALSLDDFELNHDDINKKKDVSIFKILSNRYLTTYPVFLEKK